MLVQSYLSNVAHGAEVLTSDESVGKFIRLEPVFGSSGLSATYSPWSSVEYFNRAEIQKILDLTRSCQIDRRSVISAASNPQVELPKHLRVSKKSRSKLLSSSALSRSAENLPAPSTSINFDVPHVQLPLLL